MVAPLKMGFYGIPTSDFGLGPGHDAGAPIYTVTIQTPQPASVLNLIAQARTYNYTVFANFAGSRENWTDPVGSFLHFNLQKYQDRITRWTVAGGASQQVADAIKQALIDRVFIAYVMDEQYHPVFEDTISNDTVNNLGLFIKATWSTAPGTITAIRSTAQFLDGTPTSGRAAANYAKPVNGYTGLDYGWDQYNRSAWPTPALTSYQNRKAALLLLDLGTVTGFVALDTGDDRLWDVDLNPATANARVWGSLSNNPGFVTTTPEAQGRYLSAPSQLREIADVAVLDTDSPAFVIYHYTGLGSDAAIFNDIYFQRSDYVAAFDYMLNKLATRVSWSGWRTAKGQTAPPPPPPATVQFAYTEQTTAFDTTSAAYVDVTGASIASSQFTAGRPYLICVTAEAGVNSAGGNNGSLQVLHGATAYARSEMSWTNTSSHKQNYHFWTYVSSWTGGEGLKLQGKVQGGKTLDVAVITLFALDLSTLPAGSYFDNQNSASTALVAGYTDGASITFTPGTAAHDWLILSLSQVGTPSVTQSIKSRISRSGEAVQTDPEMFWEGEDAVDDILILTGAKVATLGAVSNTFKEQSANTGGGGPRLNSEIFALDLNKFANHSFVYTDTVLDYAATSNFATQAQTLSITPTADSSVWFLASQLAVPSGVSQGTLARLQVDNIDAPLTQTVQADKHLSLDATDLIPMQIQTVRSLSKNVAHTADLDCSVVTASAGRGGRARLIVALQLSAAVGANAPPVWAAITDKTVNENETLAFVVNATDPTNEALTYSVVGTLPDGASFDPSTRTFAWTPNFNQAGVYVFTLRVTDGTTPVDATFTVTVVDVPTAVDSVDLRNLRFDHDIQGTRFPLTIRWNGGDATLGRHGIAGIVVEMVDTGRS